MLHFKPILPASTGCNAIPVDGPAEHDALDGESGGAISFASRGTLPGLACRGRGVQALLRQVEADPAEDALRPGGRLGRVRQARSHTVFVASGKVGAIPLDLSGLTWAGTNAFRPPAGGPGRTRRIVLFPLWGAAGHTGPSRKRPGRPGGSAGACAVYRNVSTW